MPKMIVINDDKARVFRTVGADALEGREDIDGVEDVVEEDVVELFVEIEGFGIAA